MIRPVKFQIICQILGDQKPQSPFVVDVHTQLVVQIVLPVAPMELVFPRDVSGQHEVQVRLVFAQHCARAQLGPRALGVPGERGVVQTLGLHVDVLEHQHLGLVQVLAGAHLDVFELVPVVVPLTLQAETQVGPQRRVRECGLLV